MPRVDRKAESRKRKKRRHSDEEEDEDLDSEIFPKWRILMIGAVVVVCLVALWPYLFGPMMNMVTGRSAGPTDNRPQQPPMHPAMNRQGAPANPAARGHMHPAAMRMAQGEAAQQPSGGRSGIFSYLLPIYTIVVMVFLVYTLSKILFKKKPKRRRRYESELSDFKDEDSDVGSGSLGKKKLQSVQKRLYETEAAMSKILEQLEELAQSKNANSQKPAEQLSPEQVLTVEQSMKQLTELTKVYKKQKKVEFDDTEEDDVSEDELNSGPSTPESTDDDDEGELQQAMKDLIVSANSAKKTEPVESPKTEVSEPKPTLEPSVKAETPAESVPEGVSPQPEAKPKVRRRARRE